MSKALKKDATYADLCAVPDNFVAEILGGELYASPRPASPHAQAAAALLIKLGGLFQNGENGPGGWRFLSEPELHFSADVVVPDIAGWRRESEGWSLVATHEADAKVRAEPFDAIELALRPIWL